MDLACLDTVNEEYFPSSVPHNDVVDETNSNDFDCEEIEERTIAERALAFLDECDQDSISDCEVGFNREELVRKISDGCGCSLKCFCKIEFEEIYQHVLNMRELTKGEKDMYIMGKLKCKGNEDIPNEVNSAKRKRYAYYYDDREVCKSAFLIIHDIGIRYLKNLLKHMKSNGAVPRKHGNEGRRPKHAFSFEDTKLCVAFILNYATENGLPRPAAPCNSDGEPPILLPSNCRKKEIHELYEESCRETETRSAKLTVFKCIWNTCCSHIKIANPRFDVCSTCEKKKDIIMNAIAESDKIESTQALLEHINLAKQEHAVYLEDCAVAKEEIHLMREMPRVVPVMPCSTEFSKVHYTADFAQGLLLPHRSRQPGPFYFLTIRKIQLFGICQEGRQQINYLIDENETIGQDGKGTHGPNAVISMLDHFLRTHGCGEMRFVLHCDNCAGQFKNRFLLGYLMWRVITGQNREIELKFQMAGHTRCMVDAGFAHIKKLYRRSDAECVSHLVDIVNKSAKSNVAQRIIDEDGNCCVEWRDWKQYLGALFKPFKGISKMHLFRFSVMQPGLLFYQEDSNSDVKTYTLSYSSNDIAGEPVVLPPAGLSRERQQYLARNVRRHVRCNFQDSLCLLIDEE